MITLVFWNPRGINNKDVEFKEFLDGKSAVYAGVSESQTYRSESALSDGRWSWEAGTEGKPTAKGAPPARGMGAFMDVSKVEASVVRVGKYTMWHRIELDGDRRGPLVVGVGYFPSAQDIAGHKMANEELREMLAYFGKMSELVVFGGDLNAHTGAKGCSMSVDEAGTMLTATMDSAGMLMVNSMAGLCAGGPTRKQVRKGGDQETVIDYAFVSPKLASMVKSMTIEENQMGSDHLPLALTFVGLTAKPVRKTGMREVWKVNDVPSPPGDSSWVAACQAKFMEWVVATGSFIGAVSAMEADSARISDIIEWSFQRALDEVTFEQLGTKFVGPRPTPLLDAATRLAIQHRTVCEDIMKQLMADSDVPEKVVAQGRAQFLQANRRVLAASWGRKELQEGRLFRDVEEKQGDSKLFWAKFKKISNTIHVSKSPPPVAFNEHGDTLTDPVEVLRAWRDFSANMASSDLTGTSEEGIYDEDYKKEVEERLEWLRRIRIYQSELDQPITSLEVFKAIRKLKIGKAAGEDGILTDILKTAADAVNTNKLKPGNSVVDALVLLFNYVFDNEVWPDRWGTGIIFPLHKQGSRLDPGNYRPITLMSCVGKLFGAVINNRLSNFSELTNSVSDEQGGFRPHRGTPDQVFILRELLASRKERGLPTYVTFIDARKAYDTVWREDAYVRIHDAGVQGKVWRQLQAMHGGLSRRLRHPLGVTDWFDVERGVAQGAVESPWIYSQFIEGLARALKAEGLGVLFAGRRIPLLMYADDIVLLAASQPELARMNSVVSRFAQQHRFQFNGSKSGVMSFNTSAPTRKLVKQRRWLLFGEHVKVVDSYEYLGTILPGDGLSWHAQLLEAIAKATRRSADLLWMCRADKGMRPRTTVTLWQSLVRPLLEYASEIWSGQVPEYLVKEAESVQMTFLRGTLGLHANGSGVANEAVRAEAGCERLRDRWDKLKLGYWRRVFSAPAGRLLRVVAEYRHREHITSGGVGLGSRGWMRTALASFTKHGMAPFWLTTSLAFGVSALTWKRMVYDAVDRTSDAERRERMDGLGSTSTYSLIKEWGVNPKAYAFSGGEVGRLGQHVPERYLDDRQSLKGTRLKLLCRLNCLPVMERVGRERKPAWPKENRVCFSCDTGRVEDVHHFIMECPSYALKRDKLMQRVAVVLSQSSVDVGDFAHMDSREQSHILLGKRIGDPTTENNIDTTVKRYLTKCWNLRGDVTRAINSVLGTEYEIAISAAA